MKPLAVLLMGPTASGKTAAALQLAAEYSFEIVSVDSAMVYRGLDIGAGKPPPEILARCPHHLVDILDPAQRYSAGQFARDAGRLIREITARGRVPLLVGGTMLYFRALLRGLAEMPPANLAFRANLDQRAARLGWPALHQELTELDPTIGERIGPNDAQRIQRALEVIALTGKPMSAVQQQAAPCLPELRTLKLALNPWDRDQLYARIERRFMEMLDAGFLNEVRALFCRGDLHSELPAMRAVGYRQLWGHLAGEYPLDEATRLGVIATRQLARRQLIWLRAEPQLQWVDSTADGAMAIMKRAIDGFLQQARA